MNPVHEKGMSLIEVMVSLIILGIVVYPLIDLFRHSSVLTVTASEEVTALYFAQKIIEGVKSIPANQIGTAQSVGNQTIGLEDRTSDEDDAYNQHVIIITGGAGSGQVRNITGYAGCRHLATVEQSWDAPIPVNNDSTYLILKGFEQRFDFRIDVTSGELALKTVQATVYYTVNAQVKEISLTTEKLMR